MRVLLIAGLLVAGTFAANAQQPDQNSLYKNTVKRIGPGQTTTTQAPAKGPAVVVVAPAKPAVVPPPQVRTPIVVQTPPPPPVYRSGHHGWDRRHHNVCHEKSHRLWQYERHAAADGYISSQERSTIRSLRRDLDRTCGGHRWRG